MGLKFNPPPGWPLPYDFEPWPGWEPEPFWPPAPPGWPLWIGSDAPSIRQDDPRLSYTGRHARGPSGAMPDQQLRHHSQEQSRRKRTERRHTRGRRIALAGVTTALAGLVAVAAVVIVADRQVANPAVAGEQTTSFSSLRPGDCFQNPPDHQLSSGEAVQVTTVGCTTAHSAQLLAQFALPGEGRYPGRKALARRSSEDCRAAVRAVRKTNPRGSVRVLMLFPDPGAWQRGVRTISCVAVGTAHSLTGSLVPGHGAANQPGSGRASSSRHPAKSSSHPGGSPGHSGGSGRP